MEDNKKFLKLSAINFVILLVLSGVFIISLFLYLPTVSDLYRDSRDLPVITQFFVNLMEFFVKSWFMCLPIVLVSDFVVALVLGFLLRKLIQKY